MVQSGKPSKYRLAVTAGLDYDPATHKPVEVNGKTLRLDDDRATIDLNVRIQDYTGNVSKFRYVLTQSLTIKQDTQIPLPKQVPTSNIPYTRTTNTQSVSPSHQNKTSTEMSSSSATISTNPFATVYRRASMRPCAW